MEHDTLIHHKTFICRVLFAMSIKLISLINTRGEFNKRKNVCPVEVNQNVCTSTT